MNIRVQKALTALLIIVFTITAGSCMAVPEHMADAQFYRPSDSSAGTDTSALTSDVSSVPASSESISSETSSQVLIQGENVEDFIKDPNNQIAADDPEDPLNPNNQPDRDQNEVIVPDDDDVVQEPPASSQPSSSSGSPASSQTQTSSDIVSSSSAPTSSNSVSSSVSSAISSIISSAISSLLPPSSSVKPPFAPPETGWYDYDGERYYFSGGKMLTGYNLIGGTAGYHFNEEGHLDSFVGIDISKWQGTNIDWNKVKADGVDFVIVRAGLRGYETGKPQTDATFDPNVKGAAKAGLNCGAYFFSQAVTEQEAEEEAEIMLQMVKDSGVSFTYPLFIDYEWSGAPNSSGRGDKISTAQRTKVVKAFCEKIKAAGYYPGIYSGASWLNNQLDMTQLSAYDVWVAQYNKSSGGSIAVSSGPSQYKKPYKIWQYTSEGKISGISGNVDRNIGLFDYPTYLKQNGYNNLK